jgi:uncharacterized protein (TIGR03437 family)
MNRPHRNLANRFILAAALLAAFAASLPGLFQPELVPVRTSAQGTQPNDGTLYALTASNNLISFNSLTPGTIIRSVPVTGLGTGETLTGLDFRPNTNQLYGVSTGSRLYTINTMTGVATVIGAAAFTPAANGMSFGFDFNPVPDRIRFVSDADQDLRLHPDTGATAAIDGTLVYAASDVNASANPNIVGAAYTNSFRGTTTTTLYGIDSNLDILVRQGSIGGAPVSPNSGQLFTVGPLGVNTNGMVGFDIIAPGDTALAALTPQGATTSSLYLINLLSGTATRIGGIGVNETVSALAAPANYVPTLAQVGIVAANSASFDTTALAPDMLASLFGTFTTQNGQNATASGMPLPTTLGGVKVTVNGTDAGLFFVSPTQINFMVPANLTEGSATLVVTNSDGTLRSGTVTIKRASPGLFTLQASGRGTLAGVATPDGVTYQAITNPDGSERPVSAGTAQNPNWIVVFGTGIRNAPSFSPNDGDGVAEAVTATIQGIPATVTYAGRSNDLPGLDQVNVIIPPQLAGAGQVTLRLTVNGAPSNPVTFTVGGTAPALTLTDVALGQNVAGTLSTGDQVQRAGNETGNVFFFDAYRFTGVAGMGVALEARSATFDAAILLYKREADGSLRLVGADEDLGGLGDGEVVNGNALLLTVLQESGEYVVFVTSDESAPSATGAYTLRLRGNALQPLAYGATVNGTISNNDLQTAAGDYLDAFFFVGAPGDAVQIRLNSSAFNPLLLLANNEGQLLKADDDSGGGQNALLTQTLTQAGVYIVVATPFAPGRTGDYTLMLTQGTSAGAPLAAVGETVAPGRRAHVLAWNGEADATLTPLAARRVLPRE